MSRFLFRTPALVMVVSVFAPLLFSQGQGDLPVWKPTVKSVAAFKNGLGFIVKSGETGLLNGWARTGPLPSAVLGTLWIGTNGKAGTVTDVCSYRQHVTTEQDSVTLSELLTANVGRKVVLTYVLGGVAQTAEGTILAAPAPEPAEEADDPTVRPPRQPVLRVGELVMLRKDGAGGTVLSIAKSAVAALELPADATLKTQVQKEEAFARVRVGGDLKSADLGMAYLAKGVIWSPSYRLEVANDTTVEIQLEAVLVNELEDMENADVSLVVGYPNFLFADVVSPLSLDQSVAAFLRELAGQTAGQVQIPSGSNFLNSNSQVISYRAGIPSQSDSAYSVHELTAGEKSEDLYFFRKTGVTLKKGDRGRFIVFSAAVPCEHVYEWNVADTMRVDEYGRPASYGSETRFPEPQDQVWHVLRLENTTKQPWTTAPAFTLRNNLPAGQDVLTYTPPGAKSSLKLTVSTDIRAEQSQIESSRQLVDRGHASFDEVRVRGTLKITSLKPEAVRLLVRKSVVGEVIQAGDGKVSKLARRLGLNPNGQIEWEFELPAGASKELTYEYTVLLSR